MCKKTVKPWQLESQKWDWDLLDWVLIALMVCGAFVAGLVIGLFWG